jgi:hypothetical protein
MNSAFIPIYYSGFWDVPHAFLTVYEGKLYCFWRDYFDEELDDYPPNYQIYLVENMKLEEAFEPYEPPFECVKLKNIPLLRENKVIGEIPTIDVIFDKTKRKFINAIAFKMIGSIQETV